MPEVGLTGPIAALALLAVGCAAPMTGSGQAAHQHRAASSNAGAGELRAFAADYLAIARPANHWLDAEVAAYTRSRHDNLAAAGSALRAEAETERGFDRSLLAISFPPPIAATARALVRANQRRIDLTELQARSASIPALLAFDGRHKAADAAVEVIRRQLGLPRPSSS